MPAKEVSMSKIKDIFRLTFESQLSQRQIASSLSLSSGVVHKYQHLARSIGLDWTELKGMDESALYRLIHQTPQKKKPVSRYVEPDCPNLHQELKRKGLTLQLLWEEYKAVHGDRSYGYSQYCRLYGSWISTQKPSMRQVHIAGEKLFLDYCGPTVDIIDSSTGQVRTAQIFVCVLGASNYTYIEATWDQTLPNWIASNVRALEFFGGAPALFVPDNLKSAVTKASRYEPDINVTYADFARHYNAAVLPARPYKPKDKAKVECGVLVVERWVLARMRKLTFFGLSELNAAIVGLRTELNEKPFKKLPGSRRSQFEALDKPALKSLPERRYEYAEFKKARVQLNYHVQVNKHYYSVPFSYLKKEIDVRITASTIECFFQSERIASHVRNYDEGYHYTTCKEHMPQNHRSYSEWTPDRFLNWAQTIGPATKGVVLSILNSKKAPVQQSYLTCMGLLQLSKKYDKDRLEAACQRSLQMGVATRANVAIILKNGLEKTELPEEKRPISILQHENIRGPAAYQNF